MKRLAPHYSFAGGLLFGLLLAQRPILLFLSGLAVGLCSFLLLRQGRGLVQWLARRFEERDPVWHPCEQCGQPIYPPSRAAYCSASCRRYARLAQEAHEIPEEF